MLLLWSGGRGGGSADEVDHVDSDCREGCLRVDADIAQRLVIDVAVLCLGQSVRGGRLTFSVALRLRVEDIFQDLRLFNGKLVYGLALMLLLLLLLLSFRVWVGFVVGRWHQLEGTLDQSQVLERFYPLVGVGV